MKQRYTLEELHEYSKSPLVKPLDCIPEFILRENYEKEKKAHRNGENSRPQSRHGEKEHDRQRNDRNKKNYRNRNDEFEHENTPAWMDDSETFNTEYVMDEEQMAKNALDFEKMMRGMREERGGSKNEEQVSKEDDGEEEEIRKLMEFRRLAKEKEETQTESSDSRFSKYFKSNTSNGSGVTTSRFFKDQPEEDPIKKLLNQFPHLQVNAEGTGRDNHGQSQANSQMQQSPQINNHAYQKMMEAQRQAILNQQNQFNQFNQQPHLNQVYNQQRALNQSQVENQQTQYNQQMYLSQQAYYLNQQAMQTRQTNQGNQVAQTNGQFNQRQPQVLQRQEQVNASMANVPTSVILRMNGIAPSSLSGSQPGKNAGSNLGSVSTFQSVPKKPSFAGIVAGSGGKQTSSNPPQQNQNPDILKTFFGNSVTQPKSDTKKAMTLDEIEKQLNKRN
jgi:hypothetical protein